MELIKKINTPGFFYIVLASWAIFFLSTHIPNIEYDVDPSYIMFGAARPPLYPMFIWLFHWAGDYQFYLIMWVQGILTGLSLLYARRWLQKNLQIPDFLIWLTVLLVLITISLRFQIWYIQSEGLAFPLFIFSFFVLIDCFRGFDIKKLLSLVSLVSLLVLTRLQFYYFYLLFILLLGWYLWQRTSFKALLLSTIILFGSMTVTTLLDHTYHYTKHGFFGGAPYGALMLLVQTLYLADSNAVSYFQNPTEKVYIQTLIDQRDSQHLNKDANLVNSLKPSYFQFAYQSYWRNYLPIQKIIEKTLKTSVENTGGTLNEDANSIALSISKVLILHELRKNTLFLLWKFINCMGGVPQFIFFCIVLLTLFLKISKDKIREANVSLIFVSMVSLITFMNAGVIALCNPDVPVYFCYSQFMLYCLASFLAKIVLPPSS